MPATVISPPSDPGTLDELTEVVSHASVAPDIRDALTDALHALASGTSVRIEPLPSLLTTGQAADLLNISRTTLVKLLDEGKLPYEQPNVHRLLRLGDVLDYKRERSAMRRAFLDEFTRESVADGTYFITASEADEAFREIRSER